MTRENVTAFEESAKEHDIFIMPCPGLKADQWKTTLDALRDVDAVPG